MVNLPIISFDKIKSDEVFIGQPTQERHYGDNLIKSSCHIKLEKGRSMIYLTDGDANLEELLPHLKKLKFSKSSRKASKNESMLFGGVPAGINKANHCCRGAVINKDSALHNLLCNVWGAFMCKLLKTYLPAWSKIGNKFLTLARIHWDYIMYDSFHTSGVINKNNEMDYHLDDQNRMHMYSGMVVFKKDVSGGYLVFPEYGFAVELSNRSILLFYGKGTIHGVTPIVKHTKDAHRYSIVFYTMDKMKDCLSFEEELKKALNQPL
jgi:hypothetical protein